MKAHRIRSVSAFNFVNFLNFFNFFNSQEYFAEMGFHGFGLYWFLSSVLSDKKKQTGDSVCFFIKSGKSYQHFAEASVSLRKSRSSAVVAQLVTKRQSMLLSS